MKTLLTKSIQRAADFIQQGEVVAFPSETVYGLGANAFDPKAVAKIFKAKGRPGDNPLIVHIASLQDIYQVAASVSPIAQKLFQHFSPGPLTIILKKHDMIPDIVSAGLKTVGIRIPALKLTRDLIKLAQCPLAAPSANLSGCPSATQWQHVFSDFQGRISCILKGSASQYGVESTVIDCSGRVPKVLRLGAISLESLSEVLALPVKHVSKRGIQLAKSPGLKYRHYAPEAAIFIYNNAAFVESGSAYISLNKPHKKNSFDLIKVCSSLAVYAKELYAFFRLCDEKKIRQIYCELPPSNGLGQTICDRILKASQKK